MKKFLAVAGVSVLALTACGGSGVRDDDNYVGVCTDGQGNRVDDMYCQHSQPYSSGFHAGDFVWGYLLANAMMPRYGQPVGYGGNHVTYNVDNSHNVYRGGVPATGGKVDYNKYKPQDSKIVKKNAAVTSPNFKDFQKQANATKAKPQDSKQFGQKGNSSYGKSGQTYKRSSGSSGGGFKSSGGSSFKSSGRR